MKELDEKIWKKFDVFGENGFLHIATTNSSIDSIRLKDGNEKCDHEIRHDLCGT